MDEAESQLTEIQFEILDAMTDDYEDIEQIYLYANREFVKERELGVDSPLIIVEINRYLLHDMIDELTGMLSDGYVKAKYSNDESIAPLDPINLASLHHYWFGWTEKGQRAWDAYRHENPGRSK